MEPNLIIGVLGLLLALLAIVNSVQLWILSDLRRRVVRLENLFIARPVLAAPVLPGFGEGA